MFNIKEYIARRKQEVKAEEHSRKWDSFNITERGGDIFIIVDGTAVKKFEESASVKDVIAELNSVRESSVLYLKRF